MSRKIRRPPPVRRQAPRADPATVLPWTIPEMQQALAHFEAHRLAEARDAYVRILERAPRLHQAAHNLGLVALQLGDLELARGLVEHALSLAPETAQYWMTLGVVADKLKDDALATRSLARAAELSPGDGLAWYNYANCLARLGRYREALACQERAAALRPDLTGIWNNLGNLYLATARLPEAETCFGRALEREPGSVTANANLALVYAGSGRRGEAIAQALRTLELAPETAEVRHNLGQWLLKEGRAGEALRISEEGLARQPDDPLLRVDRLNALSLLGRVDEACSEIRGLLARDTLPAVVHATLLNLLHLDQRATADELFGEHRCWAARHADPLTPGPRAWKRNRDPERRLRVGYVSPDLHRHPVSFFLAPVLETHRAGAAVESVCYSCGQSQDAWTARLRERAGEWCDARAMGHADLAGRIERDEIDILVDLLGHTSGTQLLVFARKPAPVQVSWLGYFNTTGLKAMDYIVVDATVCPPGEEALYVEQPLRLPACYLAYRGPDYAAEVARSPALDRGYITFGSFNKPAKIGFRVLREWAGILHAVPGSRLLLRNTDFGEGSACRLYRAELARLDVDPSRVSLEGGATHEELLACYSNLDIALDPFPYNGGTTTCEALWMGVPVVALEGERFVSRVAASVLRAAGLGELVARSREEYARKAVELASGAARLAELRAAMRGRVRQSALGDVEGFTRGLEHAYRTVWRRWCAESAG